MSYYNHWMEAFHIIAVIAWMAGMLYLPRLYVYHAEAELNSDSYVMLETMERKLLRYIMNPSMLVALTMGLILSFTTGVWGQGWFHLKFLCVVMMLVIHMMLALFRKDFVKKQNKKSSLYFRILNEVVTLLIIIIVIMVVVKPF